MTKPLTILDIARLAGVGKSTVSRVLNNDARVKDSTRAKVQAVIDQHDFLPSKSARAMRAQRSGVVGVIVAKLSSNSENTALTGLLNTLYARGYDAAIMETQFSQQKAQAHLDVLKRRNVDGIIFFGFSGCDLNALAPFAPNCVVLAVDSQQYASVSYDNQGAVTQVMNHFYHQGCRHIAFLGIDERDETTGLARSDAYQHFCQTHQLSPQLHRCEMSLHAAYAATDCLLTPQTDAIVCASDTLALGVAKRLQTLNQENIAIGGIGNHDMLRFMFPRAVSVELGYHQAGQHAAELLLKQLDETPTEITHWTQPCHLVVP
ncbi:MULTISPECIES: trehalose operon repressor TreR [unclassified Salinivibrio]|uniref:trehalose operon repressor TreR n=1 Tax=unclassified Salinivibrio TaxID=2636825 RepID=UPI000986FADF|nr:MULTISPECIES: trehalose operon repressor TreR [unclassified Salinivibrio]OOE94025.1 trehalose operon repressor [Salinivibrio sp. AR640]OOE94432.1 trehalose operon repressor [Salinivibrio sp. AR647]